MIKYEMRFGLNHYHMLLVQITETKKKNISKKVSAVALTDLLKAFKCLT